MSPILLCLFFRKHGLVFPRDAGAILIYDSYWGLNDFYKQSISFNINSMYGAPFYALLGTIGAVLLSAVLIYF
jgi:hypothetical protein